MCSDPNCNVVCHSFNPEESKICKIPEFAGSSCFEIVHHPDHNELFAEVNRKENVHTQSALNYQVPKMITKACEKQLRRRSERPRGRPKIGTKREIKPYQLEKRKQEAMVLKTLALMVVVHAT